MILKYEHHNPLHSPDPVDGLLRPIGSLFWDFSAPWEEVGFAAARYLLAWLLARKAGGDT